MIGRIKSIIIGLIKIIGFIIILYMARFIGFNIGIRL